MELRELVRLKKGVGGLEPPNNLAVLLDRTREGGETMARIFTLRGPMTVRWSNLTDGTGAVYEGPKEDHAAMSRLLKEASSKERTAETLQMEPQQIMDSKSPMDLWTTLWAYIDAHPGTGRPQETAPDNGLHDNAFTPEEIGRIHFVPKLLSPKHVQAVAKVLSQADGPHAPYFFRAPSGKGTFYIPYTRAAMTAAENDALALRSMRSRLIMEETVDNEEEGVGRPTKVRKPLYEDLSRLPLQKDDMDLLKSVCAWGAFYLENARWPVALSDIKRTGLGKASPFSLGGTQIRYLDRFDLERFVGYLFMDLARSRREELPSNILRVLLDMRLLTWNEASDAVIDHKLASGARKFHREFSRHILDVSSRVRTDISERDRDGRSDLTGLETYTIDPPDAKDFDDAISIEPLHGGDLALWVHIADVSHYIRPGDLIDAEARFRATSVYLPTGVLPMLPPVLSEDLCSLRAGTERLALSTRIVLDQGFDIKCYEHRSSIIKVRENLDYERVEGYIKEGREPFFTLDRLANGLSMKCRRLSLETPERRVRFPSPDSIDVSLKRPTPATKMIEELMVLCNECAARTIGDAGLSTLYRVHPLPDRQSVERFNGSCAALGLDVAIPQDWLEGAKDGKEGSGSDEEEGLLKALMGGGKISFGALSPGSADIDEGIKEGNNGPGPSVGTGPDMGLMNRAVDAFNSVLLSIRRLTDASTADLLNIRLLRVLPRALYSDRNIGHFGLRSERYCHFTSPIRRYADVLAHRTVKWLMAKDGAGPQVPWEAPSPEEVASMMENINDMSQSAEEWEREMVNVALATKVAMDPSFKGAARMARLVSLIPSAAFFLMDDGVTEGRIPLSQLSPFRLHLDTTESMLIADPEEEMGLKLGAEREFRMLAKGNGPQVFMRLGERVGCAVRSISIAEGRVDLSLAGRSSHA
jgi:exoribonuclease R